MIYFKNLGFKISSSSSSSSSSFSQKVVYLKEYSQIRIPLKLIQLMPSIRLSPSALRKNVKKANYGVKSLIQMKWAMCVQEGMFAHLIM